VAPTTAAAAASGKMTPQQIGLILSGLDAALKPYLDRKVISYHRVETAAEPRLVDIP